MGLGDPNNNTFYFHHRQLPGASTSCFYILKEPKTANSRYYGNIPLDEIEDHEYKWYEPLTLKKSKKNRVLLSKTDNLMPHFVDNFLRFAKAELY
jgi:wobble nucleotide-excising tRNase